MARTPQDRIDQLQERIARRAEEIAALNEQYTQLQTRDQLEIDNLRAQLRAEPPEPEPQRRALSAL